MAPDADLLVLGGGCAGLSLARDLALGAGAGRRAPRVVVLEARTTYAEDRTWCFWDDGTAPWSRLASHAWDRIAVGAGGQRAVAACGATPYRMVRALDFYHEALRAVREQGGGCVALHRGVSVAGAPRRVGDAWEVATSEGALRARHVVDTRPGPVPVRGGAVLWQSFAGHEVECEAPVFDPGCATLMEFGPGLGTPDPRGVAFTYVLPMSRTRALVERTVFGPDPLGAPALARALDAAIEECTGGTAHRVLRQEAGVLPMGLAATPPGGLAMPGPGGWVRAGVGGGAARPSTGYAFVRVQRWAARCAAAVLAGGPPVGAAPDGWRVRGMDALLLHALRARPEVAPALFVQLFARADTARLLRFLGDGGGWLDGLAVAAALPVGRFAGALWAARPGGREACAEAPG